MLYFCNHTALCWRYTQQCIEELFLSVMLTEPYKILSIFILVSFEEALTSKICESHIFDLWWLWIVTISHGRLTRKNPSLTLQKHRRTQRGSTVAWQKFPFCLIFSFLLRYFFSFVSQNFRAWRVIRLKVLFFPLSFSLIGQDDDINLK